MVCAKMIIKDRCLPVNAKFVSAFKCSLINTRNWTHIISDVTDATEIIWREFSGIFEIAAGISENL